MPKLKNRNPKLDKLGNYAVVRYGGKIHYLGKHSTAEALAAYNRFCVGLQNSPTLFLAKQEGGITVGELTAAYLDYAETMLNNSDYGNVRTIAFDFLLKLYGGKTTAEEFTPPCLKRAASWSAMI